VLLLSYILFNGLIFKCSGFMEIYPSDIDTLHISVKAFTIYLSYDFIIKSGISSGPVRNLSFVFLSFLFPLQIYDSFLNLSHIIMPIPLFQYCFGF